MVKFIFVIATLLVAITSMTGLALSQAPLGPDFMPGEIVVKFRPQISGPSARQSLRGAGATLLESSRWGGLLRAQTPAGREAEVIARLQAHRDVEFATYNYRVQGLGDPNDPDYLLQWGLDKIAAASAWDIYSGGDNITIAIVDSGVDLDHLDLQANIVAGYDFANDDALPDDDNGHGTHVAGIAAAEGNNSIGIAGVSWAAKIMPVKILDANGYGTTFNLAQAIYYGADNGAQIINMSLGGACGDWPEVEAAIDYAVSKGLLLVAAAGNNNTAVFCPAAIAGVMAVGATTSLDTRWSGSNYGDQLEVSAPGYSIYSTTNDGSYGYKTGTSMASPYVAGLAALLWSFEPSLTADQVAAFIRQSSDDLGDQGWDPYYGDGRINARRTLEALNLWVPPEKTLHIDGGTTSISASIPILTFSSEVITWTAAISPTVPWLSLTSPVSGTISTASSPGQLDLVATQPFTYGVYTTAVVVNGTTSTGDVLDSRETKINLIYQAKLYQMYLPILFKDRTSPFNNVKP